MFKLIRFNLIPVLGFSYGKVVKPSLFEAKQLHSSDESDSEVGPELPRDSKYQKMHLDLSKMQTIDDVLKLYVNNIADFNNHNIFIPMHQLVRLLIPQQPRDRIQQLINNDDRFTQFMEDVAKELEEQTAESLVYTLKLVFQLVRYGYEWPHSTALKGIIESRVHDFSNLQASELFVLYSKMKWNPYQISTILKEQLQIEDSYTAYALLQIIRGCFYQTKNGFIKGTRYPDLCYQAQKQLIKLLQDNVTHHSKVALFLQLANMKLFKTTSHKSHPQILTLLQNYFIENITQLSTFQLIKVAEAYKYLPRQQDTILFHQVQPLLLQAEHSNQSIVKLFITLVDQRPQLIIDKDTQNLLIGKISQLDLTTVSPSLMLSFLELCCKQQLHQKHNQFIRKCLELLITSKINNHQRVQLGSLIIQFDFIDWGYELLKFDSENLLVLVKQGHVLVEQIYKLTDESAKQEVRRKVEQIVNKLDQLETPQRIGMMKAIVELPGQQYDPFYDFVGRHLKIEELDEQMQIHFLFQLSNKIYLNLPLRNILSNFNPTLEQLKQITYKLNSSDMISDKFVKHFSLWLNTIIDKSQIDNSLDLSLVLNLYGRTLTNTPAHSLHNMRGTVSKYFRELTQKLSKITLLWNGRLDIPITMIDKMHGSLSRINIRSSLMFNIVQNYCTHQPEVQYKHMALCDVISKLQLHGFANKESILQFLNKCAQLNGNNLEFQIQRCKLLLFMHVQYKMNPKLEYIDDVHLGIEMDLLKHKIIESGANVDALMVLLDYDAWLMSNMSQDQSLADFISNHFQTLMPQLNMMNMRPGLKNIITTIKQYDAKHQFNKTYATLFQQMFSRCKHLQHQEKLNVGVCLEYLEFARSLKVSDKPTIEYLLTSIEELSHNLRQTQIIDLVQKLADMKIFRNQINTLLSGLIIKKIEFYSAIELLDCLNAFAKIGYFNNELANIIYKNIKLPNQNNPLQSIAYLWTLMLYHGKIDNKQFIGMLTPLLQDFQRFTQNFNSNVKIPLVYRQYMDIYNILHLIRYTKLQLSTPLLDLTNQIISEGQEVVTKHLLFSQKLTKPVRNIQQIFDEAAIECKINYLFDNQYVDFYIPKTQVAIIVDNSLYVSQDLETYTGFHYFNQLIMAAVADKFSVRVQRIRFWEWLQLNREEKHKVLGI